MLLVHLGVMVLLVALGLVFSRGKGAFLIAGYNTAPKEEKAKYDEGTLCRFMGKLMFILAVCWVPVTAGGVLEIWWLFWVGFAAFLATVLVGIAYANTGNRFKKRK